MSGAAQPELTLLELLVLSEAGGDNTLDNAYGVVQLYRVFEQERDLLTETESALLRLLDLDLVRFVKATYDIGYTAQRQELPPMTRDELLSAFKAEDWETDIAIWFDPTPEGERVLAAVPEGLIPRLSGRIPRPWLD
jgi:hypothetical protein